MTAQLPREILDSVRDDIETLGMNEVMSEGEDAPALVRELRGLAFVIFCFG
jgi:hypothetical protein